MGENEAEVLLIKTRQIHDFCSMTVDFIKSVTNYFYYFNQQIKISQI